MAKAKIKGDVQWFVPGKKKPIAYSTKATKDLIGLLAEDYETIQDVCNAINYDPEAKAIMQIYINLGYGNQIAREWFKY